MSKRPDNFKCRVKKHATRESAARVRWAMALRGVIKDASALDINFCQVCQAWHLTRAKRP